MKAGNDASVKEYLANQMKYYKVSKIFAKLTFKEKSARVEQHLAFTESDLTCKLTKTSTELNTLKEERKRIEIYHEQQLNDLKNNYSRDSVQLKEEHVRQLRSLQEKYGDEKSLLENNSHSDLKELRSRIDDFMGQNRTLTADNLSLDTKNKDLTKRVENLESERAQLVEELSRIRLENKDLDSSKFQNEKNLNKSSVRILRILFNNVAANRCARTTGQR
jgi:uncharacterized protein (DUF3084 family)